MADTKGDKNCRERNTKIKNYGLRYFAFGLSARPVDIRSGQVLFAYRNIL